MSDSNTPEKIIILLSMLYISLFFASMTVGYKIVAFHHELYCASILIFPLLFPFSDALAELYGVKIAKTIVWYTIICEIVFVGLTNIAIRFPSPPSWHHQAEYNFIVGGYVHILLANVTALLVSFYLNVIFLNRWRILLKGKHYYLRSLGATAIGEITYTILTNAITYAGILHCNEIINIILSDYILKLFYSIIVAYPGALAVMYIKSKYRTSSPVSINPFQYGSIEKVIKLSNFSRKNFSIHLSQKYDESTN